MPSRYTIHLFGQPVVLDSEGVPVAGLGLGKPLALLSYLVVEGRTSREQLITLLWGDVPEVKARNAFRQALHRLRTALGDEVVPQDPDSLFVAEGAAVTTDIREFERALDSGDIESALAAYRGDFLLGLNVNEPSFDTWQDSRRKRYRARFRDALRASIQSDLESGEVTRALQRSATLADSDATDADAAILHATTLLGAGRRAEALHSLQEFERRFEEEMEGSVPSSVREFTTRLRRTPPEQTSRAGSRTRAVFVGRESELALLLARLSVLEGGSGSLLLIDGEAGFGKTRLIDEFFERAGDMGDVLLLLGRERAPEAGIPYASVGEALRGVLDAPGLAGTGQHLLAEAARLLPQLRDQFSLPAITEIVDDAGRLRFYEGVAALLDSVAYEQPVCIALDDFHNASPTTVGLVQYLVDRLRTAPILFLLSGRTTPVFSRIRRQMAESLTRGARLSADDGRAPMSVTLGALESDAARRLVIELAGPAADDSTAEEILAVSGGSPFRIAEAAQRVRAGERFETSPVPIRDVLWSRLQRCTQAEQRLFVTVALFDRPVPIRLLAAASHLPEKSALDAALSLEREGFLIQRPEGMTPAHDFAGDLALEGTGPAGRALLAGWAAEALEREGSGSPAELARLFTLGGRRREAFSYSRAAAYESMKTGAREEALQHFRTALATASAPSEREEIETMVGSIGRETLRLSGETAPVSPAAPLSTGAPGRATPAEQSAATDSALREEAGASEPASQRRLGTRHALVLTLGLGVIVFAITRALAFKDVTGAPGTSLADTLIVARELDPRDTVIAFTTGPLGSPLVTLDGASRHGRTRTWVDSLRLPWTNPLPSPDTRSVAVERITKDGSDLYVISADRRDTLPLSTGPGDDFSSGWSPDSRWVLATHGETRDDGSYGSALFAYSVAEPGRRIAFDTSSSRAVVEAAWSPDGSHVAWTARVGTQHQQDIFLSDADGKDVRSITSNPGEDYSIAWSPDGTALAFTSERSGRAELYSWDIASESLRRLTWDGAHADHAVFSPDGRWLAYESTKGGTPAVYVMPSGGGTGRSVAPVSSRVTLVGWRGGVVPYVDQVFVDIPPLVKPGDVGTIVVRAADRKGNAVRPGTVHLDILDPGLIEIRDGGSSATRPSMADSFSVRALSRGLARIRVSAGSWRADTAYIPIGRDALALLTESFERGLRGSVWRILGVPAPRTERGAGSFASTGLVARSDREWESGALSRTVFPVRGGLTVEVWVKAPFAQPAGAAKSFAVALVAADPAEVLDSIAPKFLRLATVSWVAEAGRLSYAVGREVFTEPLSAIGQSGDHRISIEVGADDLVAFSVDGKQRWKSSLRVRTAGDNSRAQLWLGSQATDREVVFDDVAVRLLPVNHAQAERR